MLGPDPSGPRGGLPRNCGPSCEETTPQAQSDRIPLEDMYGPFGESASDYDGYIDTWRYERPRSIDEEYHAQAEYNKGGFSAAFWAKPKKTIKKKKKKTTGPLAQAA